MTEELRQGERIGVLAAVPPAVQSGLQRPDELLWSDSSARAVLQLMVEAVAEMIGFEVAVLSVILDDQMVTVAYTGPEEFRTYLEEPDPVAVLDPVLAQAQVWERFRFLAEEDYDANALEGHWVVWDDGHDHGPDSWRANDVLLGLLHDGERLVGVLSVDRPLDGRRPDARQRRLLEKYAAQAERAVVTAFEREALVKQVEHAATARRLIRAASMPTEASLDSVILNTHTPLVEGFQALGSWVQVLEPEVGHALRRDGSAVEMCANVVELARELAPGLWTAQEAAVVGQDVGLLAGVQRIPAPMLVAVERHLADHGVASMLAVAVGAGAECLGFLAVFRGAGDPAWSAVEVESALQIGHDLGAALVAARALESERGLVRDLKQLEDYRSQLISTLSHELRTPLTVIAGNLELLEGVVLDEGGERIAEAMQRGTTRMQKVVDDLLLLARVSDPSHPLDPRPVDLRRLVEDVVSLVGTTAELKKMTLEVDLDPDPLVVPGDPVELDRMVANLLSNAVKYTPPGGEVDVRVVRRGDEVELRVRDTGLGISVEDQARLFGAFFRSTNPAALQEQGTGLGLTIVSTVVGRHGGGLEVDSALGEGTTFTVILPAAVAGSDC